MTSIVNVCYRGGATKAPQCCTHGTAHEERELYASIEAIGVIQPCCLLHMVGNRVCQLGWVALLRPVAHTPCQKYKCVSIYCGQHEIVCLPAGQTQRIDEMA